MRGTLDEHIRKLVTMAEMHDMYHGILKNCVEWCRDLFERQRDFARFDAPENIAYTEAHIHRTTAEHSSGRPDDHSEVLASARPVRQRPRLPSEPSHAPGQLHN